MKLITRSSLALLAAAGLLLSQDMVRNSRRPSSPDAGRVIALEKTMSIEDTGGEFYFKAPRFPRIAADGSVFVLDEGQLLEFSPQGDFVRNYFKKGQGPGEVQNVLGYLVEDGKVFLQDLGSNKIVVFDRAGKLVEEIKLAEGMRAPRLLSRTAARFYMSAMSIDRSGPGPVMTQSLSSVSLDGRDLTEILTFPVDGSIRTQGGAVGGVVRTALTAVPYGDRWMFANCTPEYSVSLVDLDGKRIVRRFGRDYDRVKNSPTKGGPAGQIVASGSTTIEAPEFKNDVAGLVVRGGRLLVLTSTVDPKKGALVDVFDPEGRYEDSFYLLFPAVGGAQAFTGTGSAFSEEAVAFIARDEDGLARIVKCRLK